MGSASRCGSPKHHIGYNYVVVDCCVRCVLNAEARKIMRVLSAASCRQQCCLRTYVHAVLKLQYLHADPFRPLCRPSNGKYTSTSIQHPPPPKHSTSRL